MRFLAAFHSDVGIYKKNNQDSLCLKIVRLKNEEEIAMIVVCDGMGGLEKGELASATIIRAFAEWFDNSLPDIIEKGFCTANVKDEWESVVVRQNEIINSYGEKCRIQLGTTLTAIMIAQERFIVCQVGDSRVYRITNKIEQLTEDQTLVQRDVLLGLISPEQARCDPRKNILLQCIGASKMVVPVYTEGIVQKGEQYLLCSDGFRNKISDDEILKTLVSESMIDDTVMKNRLINLVELNKSRNEKDNITVSLVKVV